MYINKQAFICRVSLLSVALAKHLR
jgi:hypothetical protein